MDATRSSTVLAVVGNPKAGSRTATVATAVATAIAGDPADVELLEVAELGVDLLGWGAPPVTAAVARMCAARALVVASPVFKATYTGLLKLLADQIAAGQLGGVPAVPVMVGAAPQHALAVEVHLRPLLVELGASCPTPGLFVLERDLDRLDEVVEGWLGRSPALGVPSRA